MKIAREVRGLKRQRPPDLSECAIEHAAGGQHANHLVRLAVENNLAAQNVGIGAELRLPKSMAQNRHVFLADLILIG